MSNNKTQDSDRCQDVDLFPGVDLTLWVRLVLALLVAAVVAGLLVR